MNMNNLFIPLHKLAKRQDENFLTEILVFLLNHYVQYEPESAVWLIKRITDKLDLSVKDLRILSVEAQHHTLMGVPDIKIETPYFICFIEAKVDSNFGEGQLKDYKSVLDDCQKEKESIDETLETKLITLTRYTCKDHKADMEPDFGFRWHQLSDWLDKLIPNAKSGGTEFPSFKKKDGFSVFITQQYIQFLKNRGVAMEKINWQLVQGLREFRNILVMIREAIATSGAEIGNMSVGQSRGGYYAKNKRFFVGIPMDNPEELVFEVDTESCVVEFRDDEPVQKVTTEDVGIGISGYDSNATGTSR
jgi:hypothetical protein